MRAEGERVEIGAFYAGGGMTVRVLELFDDVGGQDVRVAVVLRRGHLLKRPETGVIPLSEWGRMAKTVDPAKYRIGSTAPQPPLARDPEWPLVDEC